MVYALVIMTNSHAILRKTIIVLGWALIAILPALLSSCGKRDLSVPTPTIAAGATPAPRFSLNVKPEDYFGLFPFHLDWVRKSTVQTLYPSRDDGVKYQKALTRLRSDGMETLSPDERQLVLLVSWYARVMQTQTIKYREEERGNTGETTSLIEIEEQYEFRESQGLRFPYPLSYLTTPLKPKSPWTGEMVVAYDIVDDGGEEDAIMTVWSRVAQVWYCQRLKASGPNISNLVWPALPQEFAEATPAGVENVNGRPAYKLRAGQSYSIGPFPQYLWIDVETLLPVQESYDEGEGKTKLVTILEINGQVEVTPPSVDIPCPEHDYGETPTPE